MGEEGPHTWLALADRVRDVLHEDPAFQLQFCASPSVCRLLVLVLLFLRVHFLAAEQYHLEEVDLVLFPSH